MKENNICYLVCAGERSELDFKKADGDLIIAVDGGLKYLNEAGIKADIALGDFDSLNTPPEATEIIRLNPIKDVTDTFAAATLAVERGYKILRIYSALGGRLSHTMANIQTLNYLSDIGVDAKIIGSGVEVYICKDIAKADNGGMLSVFPITDSADISIQGCKYSGNFTLTKKDSLGVSNEPQKNATVTVNDGVVLVVIEKDVK